MIKKVFVDSDVIPDVATARVPFVDSGKTSLSLIENGLALGVISANSVTNIYHILRKLSSPDKAKPFLRTILKYISVISVDHDTVIQALESKFLDFEDGVQHFCAVKNRCDLILTRNTQDYVFPEWQILEPLEFVALY